MAHCESVGLIRLNDCCLFTWSSAGEGRPRTIEIRAEHCERCIAELLRTQGGKVRLTRARPDRSGPAGLADGCSSDVA
jgi:hypothetical protein